MTNRALELAWNYHERTKHSYWSIRTSPHYLDWDNRPFPFKVYPEIEPIALSQDLLQTGVPALAALASTGAGSSNQVRPNLDQLTGLLYYSAGVTKRNDYPGGTTYFRAAACAGALYPIETYIVCGDIERLSAGVYHFNPGDFALRRLRRGDFRDVVARATANDPQAAAAPLILIYTAISWRSTWKYCDRAYRYHFWDSGTILANALAAAVAHELPARVVMGFVDADVNKLIGIDGKRELALSLLTIGYAPEAQTGVAPAEEYGKLEYAVLPLSPSEVDYPSIYEMHRASSLKDQTEVSQWRGATIEGASAKPPGKLIPLADVPGDQLPDSSIEEVIQRRASTRRFARKAISFQKLSVVLDRAMAVIPADFLPEGATHLNDIYLIINRVEGLEAGAYFYNREARALELLKEGDFSDKASYLALDQQLAGDASVTLFHLTDFNRVFERLGNRGYRAAHTEAGIVGGKIYLASYALGRGATGLTFYDNDVTEFFSPHAEGKSCIFVTSIGIPGKRPLY